MQLALKIVLLHAINRCLNSLGIGIRWQHDIGNTHCAMCIPNHANDFRTALNTGAHGAHFNWALGVTNVRSVKAAISPPRSS
jgi:hypothetical protein